jgi:hypothetical protein
MRFPPDFPPPNLPPETYRCFYSGASKTYPGARHAAVQRSIGNDLWESVALFYDTNILGVLDAPGHIQFPSRQEMYNYIETMCILNTWEEQDE